MNSHLCCIVKQVNLRIGRGMSGEIGSPKIACLMRHVNDRMQKRERAECDAIKRRIMMSRNGQEGKSDAMRAMKLRSRGVPHSQGEALPRNSEMANKIDVANIA